MVLFFFHSLKLYYNLLILRLRVYHQEYELVFLDQINVKSTRIYLFIYNEENEYPYVDLNPSPFDGENYGLSTSCVCPDEGLIVFLYKC